MEKIGIITIHFGINFGSVLQTVATYRIFKSLGYDVIVIDYVQDCVKISRFIKGAFSSLTKLVWRTINLPGFIKNRNIYSSYLKKYVTLSKQIASSDDFSKVCPKCDIYVTGSDQVWNSIHNEGFNGRYFYEGISENATKIAFASSIGRDDFDDIEKPKVKELLKGYKAVSVREDSAVRILSKLGIEAVQILDPTFLLDRFQWKEYRSERIVKKPYLLIYTPYNTVDKKTIYNSARAIASKRDLEIVTFSWNMVSERLADRTIKWASPGDFLSLMYYADFVITNSFHGTAFSINLNKQFVVFQPSAFSTRIESILRKTLLADRLMFGELKGEEIPIIDYVDTNAILDKEREYAMNFLRKTLH